MCKYLCLECVHARTLAFISLSPILFCFLLQEMLYRRLSKLQALLSCNAQLDKAKPEKKAAVCDSSMMYVCVCVLLRNVAGNIQSLEHLILFFVVWRVCYWMRSHFMIDTCQCPPPPPPSRQEVFHNACLLYQQCYTGMSQTSTPIWYPAVDWCIYWQWDVGLHVLVGLMKVICCLTCARATFNLNKQVPTIYFWLFVCLEDIPFYIVCDETKMLLLFFCCCFGI